MIALVDYRAGNLTSVRKAFAAAGAELYTPDSPSDLAAAAAIVVPGVGHFEATRVLDGPWREAILERVGEGRPLLGICLGMQWLYEGSEEAPGLRGLGLFGGRCFRLRGRERGSEGGPAGDAIKVPHVGWNAVAVQHPAPIVEGVRSGEQMYFTHSYVAPVTEDTVGVTEHAEPFASIVQRGYIAGVQFHPEKSGDAGVRIVRNFVEMSR